MGLEPDELSISIQQTIVDNRPLPIYPEPIHSMALVPADINLAASEMQLSSAIAREYRLKNGLLNVQDNYDFILIDCPPSLGLLSIISLTAATHILVPIQCQFKSFKGTELLLSTITQVRSHTTPDCNLLDLFLQCSMVGLPRNRVHLKLYKNNYQR